MTEITASLELNKFMSDQAPQEKSQSAKSPLYVGGLLIVALLVGSYLFSSFAIETRKTEILAELETRETIMLAAKNEVFATWSAATAQKANTIANHPLFRLFSAEVNQANGQDLPRALANQLPYMQNAITNFVQQNSPLAAYVVGRNGRAFLASNGAPALTNEQRRLAVEHYKNNDIATVNSREHGTDLLVDFLVPITAEQSPSGSISNVVGVMVITVSALEKMEEMLRPNKLSLDGEESNLLQLIEGKLYLAAPSADSYFSKTTETDLDEDTMGFGLHSLSGNKSPLFSGGQLLGGTNWVLLEGVRADAALKSVKQYSYGVYILSGSLSIVVLSIFAAIWLTLRSQNTKAMANQYKDLAYQINTQRRLLGSINNTIDDLIGLTDTTGRYVYANPSLARFTDFPVQSIPGKTERDLFGDKTARQLTNMNQKVMDTEQSVNTILEVETEEGTKILRVEKSRLLDDDGLFMGIVTVAGDITEFIENQRMKERLGQKTISVLVRMLEANDPYLANHSNRVGTLANSVATTMNLPREVRQTISTGAHLSQIGKISIPAEIRTKEGRLSDEERLIMRGHVTSAESLLSEMELDPPIVAAVAQMYERKDGTGYPHQIAGEDIDMSARILGMADILVARISPRSYRKAVSVEEAMEVFRSNMERYDQDVVVAMDTYLTSEAGQSFKDEIEHK